MRTRDHSVSRGALTAIFEFAIVISLLQALLDGDSYQANGFRAVADYPTPLEPTPAIVPAPDRSMDRMRFDSARPAGYARSLQDLQQITLV